VTYCTIGDHQLPHSVFAKHIYYTSSCSLSTRVRFLHSWAGWISTMNQNITRPCSSTLGQVERFCWTDPLSLFHLFHVDLKTPLFLFHLFHVDLEPVTRFYLFHLYHLCQLVPTCAIWLYHLNLCQLLFLRFFFGFKNVILRRHVGFESGTFRLTGRRHDKFCDAAGKVSAPG